MTDTLEPSGYPAFSTPGASGRALYDAGWRVFSICSNHTYDLGTEGITETLAVWDEMAAHAHGQSPGDICWTGLWRNGTEDQIPVLEYKGKKLAFLTYTYGTNDIELPEDEEYDTLGGLVFSRLTEIPADGEHPEVECYGLRIRVEELSDRRVEWAVVEKLVHASEDADAAPDKD